MSTLKKDYPDRSAIENALKAGVTDFSRQDFTGLDLSELAFHENSDFSESDFSRADMRRGRALYCVFRGASFVETRATYADFSGSNFFEASAHRADFSHTNFSDCDMYHMKVHRVRFDKQILPWLPSILEFGVRMPTYRVEGLGE